MKSHLYTAEHNTVYSIGFIVHSVITYCIITYFGLVSTNFINRVYKAVCISMLSKFG